MATELKPIRNEADHEAALAEVERLWGAKSGTPKGDRLDVLVTLIGVYEEKHHPIDAPDPVQAIEFRMEQMGLTRKDLEPLIGKRWRVSEVLNKKRPLSLTMIRRLSEKLGIPAEVLIRPCVAPRIRPARHLSDLRVKTERKVRPSKPSKSAESK
jgi:HTH-type transcriptional regulator / antitoxin HigA